MIAAVFQYMRSLDKYLYTKQADVLYSQNRFLYIYIGGAISIEVDFDLGLYIAPPSGKKVSKSNVDFEREFRFDKDDKSQQITIREPGSRFPLKIRHCSGAATVYGQNRLVTLFTAYRWRHLQFAWKIGQIIDTKQRKCKKMLKPCQFQT